jgi:cell division protein FtsB
MNYENLKLFYAQASRWAFPLMVVIFLVSLLTCNRQPAENSDLSDRLAALEAKTVQLENKNGQLVAENKQLTASKAELKGYTDTIFNLKRSQEKLIKEVTTFAKIVQAASFHGKTATFNDSQPNPSKDGDTAKIVYIEQPRDPDLIRVPRSFSFADSTIQYAGTVLKDSVRMDSIKITNALYFRAAVQKTGFLRLGRTNIVQAFNTNPAIVNTGLTSAQVKIRPNFWNRVLKPVLFAVGAGYVGYKIGSQ